MDMIRINLLPPELRRRRSGGAGLSADPATLAMVLGAAAVLAALGFWLWVQMVRIPAAEALLADRQAELRRVEAEAKKVDAINDQISAILTQVNDLNALIASKVRWAEPLNDFADMLGRNRAWEDAGFNVASTSLTIVPQAAAGARGARGTSGSDMPQRFAMTWNFQLVGLDRSLSGNYLEQFFKEMADHYFWTKHGFQDQPVDSYRGDAPVWNNLIQRVIVERPLVFIREQIAKAQQITVPPAVTAGRAGGEAASGRRARRRR